MTTAQITDGENLMILAKIAQKEGWSKTKFATFAGISPYGAGLLYDSDEDRYE
jgi:hypothetical protein